MGGVIGDWDGGVKEWLIWGMERNLDLLFCLRVVLLLGMEERKGEYMTATRNHPHQDVLAHIS